MAARACIFATHGHEPRQARKGAAVAALVGRRSPAGAGCHLKAARPRPSTAKLKTMSYIALARKWRPKRFAEMVGQEHVLRALANALDSGKVDHAFLVTGTGR